MELLSRNHSDPVPTPPGQLIQNFRKYSSDPVPIPPPSPNNGSVIALGVATIPILVLILILVSFKICEKICPHGQRRDLISRPSRSISMMSNFSSISFTMSRNNSSSQLSGSGSASVGSHLNLSHVHPPQTHHQHVTTRADGTPLILTELETIRDQDEEEDVDVDVEEHLNNEVKV